MKKATCLAMLVMSIIVLGGAICFAEEVVKKDSEGNVVLKYNVNADGVKQGSYEAFFKDGSTHVKTTYSNDKINGRYLRYYENGNICTDAEYAMDKKHGRVLRCDADGNVESDEIYSNDILLYTKTEKDIKATLAEIAKGNFARKVTVAEKTDTASALRDRIIRKKPGESDDEDEDGVFKGDTDSRTALRRLNSYRFLADVPFDVQLSEDYTEYTVSAAKILELINRLDHTPDNPGLPEDEYKKAYHGTSHSNLHMGKGTEGSVDGYMFDSDTNNIDRLGHRRWCINPSMAKTAFGENGKYSAMYAFDSARSDVPDYDFVPFPPRGYMVSDYFSVDHAWNVSLNPSKYKAPVKDEVTVEVTPLKRASKGSAMLDIEGRKGKSPLELNYFNVENGGYGISYCVIFRPENVRVTPGSCYWVEIKGIKDSSGNDAEVAYLVEFI